MTQLLGTDPTTFGVCNINDVIVYSQLLFLILWKNLFG